MKIINQSAKKRNVSHKTHMNFFDIHPSVLIFFFRGEGRGSDPLTLFAITDWLAS